MLLLVAGLGTGGTSPGLSLRASSKGVMLSRHWAGFHAVAAATSPIDTLTAKK
jgi:hypothetical protein